MIKYKHYDPEVGCINQDGKPDVEIPLPLYTHMYFLFPAYQCGCGKKFRLEGDYMRHYRLENESEWFMDDES